jgi:hypothetical protein
MANRFSLAIVFALLSAPMVAAVAPGPPQNLAAAVNGNAVTLSWSAPSTGGVPSSYILEASLSPSGPIIAAFTVEDTTVVVTNVPNGIYYARVRAVNADGSSAASNEVIVVVPGGSGCTPPNPPTNLASSVFLASVTVTWTAPAGPCPVTGYVVQVGSAPGLTDLTVFNVDSETTTLTASAPPGTYYVRVVAINGFGGSLPSNEIVISVSNEPPNLAGRWSGTSTYFNAPFTFELMQNGRQVTGAYSDQRDKGSVSGIVNIGSVILDVTFGDTGLRFEGSIENANRIRGTIRGTVIGGTFPFVMTR